MDSSDNSPLGISSANALPFPVEAWRDGGVAERAGLENRILRKRDGGSPSRPGAGRGLAPRSRGGESLSPRSSACDRKRWTLRTIRRLASLRQMRYRSRWKRGEMAEWPNAPVLKTGSCASGTGVQIPLSPKFFEANKNWGGSPSRQAGRGLVPTSRDGKSLSLRNLPWPLCMYYIALPANARTWVAPRIGKDGWTSTTPAA